MSTDLLSTIGAIIYLEGAMIDARVWIDRADPSDPDYYGQCMRGNEIVCHVGPYKTPYMALVHAVAEALSTDPRRE